MMHFYQDDNDIFEGTCETPITEILPSVIFATIVLTLEEPISIPVIILSFISF